MTSYETTVRTTTGPSSEPHTRHSTPARFSDIPPAIDIPVSSLDADASEVEVRLDELPHDPAELCDLLSNERAAKSYWAVIALAYVKQGKVDLAINILNRGLVSVAQGAATKDRVPLLTWICWLYIMKSRRAPRNAHDTPTYTKEQYLKAANSALDEAWRLNPAFPPLALVRGVLSVLQASLQPPPKVAWPGTANRSQRAETLRQALRAFDESIKSSHGRNVMAGLGRARSLYLLGRYADALEGYQQVLIKAPNMTDPDPRIGIGCCLWKLDFKGHAKVAWARALDLNPSSQVANALLGIYHLWESARHALDDASFGESYTTAISRYAQSAFRLDKEDPTACAMLAGYFLARHNFDNVDKLASKTVDFADTNAAISDGWYLLGRKEHYQGNTTKASECYLRADQARGGADRDYLPARFGVVQMQVKSNDLNGAKFRLEKIVQQTKNPESMTLLGALYAEEVFAAQTTGFKEDKTNEAKKAIQLLEAVRSMWKDEKKKVTRDESVLIYLARLYEGMSPDKSMHCLEQVEEMQIAQIPAAERPEEPSSGEEQGTNVDSRKNSLRKLLSPQLLNAIGCFLYQSNKMSQASQIFQVALSACRRCQRDEEQEEDKSRGDGGEGRLDPFLTTISYNLARTYEAASLTDEAKKLYGEILEKHPNYNEANARLSYISLRESPTGEGPKKIARLYEAEATNLEIRALFGWYLNKSKRRVANVAEDQEQRHYKHTLQGYDKHDKYALTGMGNIFLMAARDMRRDSDQDREKRHRMYEKAVEFFDKALQLDPRNAYAAQGVGIALVDDRKDHGTAVHIFSKVKDTLQDPSVYLNLGHVFAELKQYNKSIESYETALSKNRSRDTQILACLGRVWLLKGMQEHSIATLNTALDYTQRAASTTTPAQPHLDFNIAFVRNQIALLVIALPETQKTSQDVEAAAAGLDLAIESFTELSKAKHPPYPQGSLEARSSMCRTMRNRLDRVLQSQREYEEKNAAKLHQARRLREEDLHKRQEAKRQQQEAEAERKRLIAEDRAHMVAEAQRISEKRAAAAAEKARLEELENASSENESDRGRDRDRERGSPAKKSRKRKQTATSTTQRRRRGKRRAQPEDEELARSSDVSGGEDEEIGGQDEEEEEEEEAQSTANEDDEAGHETHSSTPRKNTSSSSRKKRQTKRRRTSSSVTPAPRKRTTTTNKNNDNYNRKYKSSERILDSDEDEQITEEPEPAEDAEMRDLDNERGGTVDGDYDKKTLSSARKTENGSGTGSASQTTTTAAAADAGKTNSGGDKSVALGDLFGDDED